ncbi:MAG: VOC family protein [Amylibacter sp.]
MSVFGRVVIYVRDVKASIAFYEETFGFVALRDPSDRIVELNHPEEGGAINLHLAAKSQKIGQDLVMLVFDVADVEAFVKAHPKFGAIHRVPGYEFSNGKDLLGIRCLYQAAYLETPLRNEKGTVRRLSP